MSSVKDLFENEKLMTTIIEELEEIPEDAEVFYAVWALGYDNKANFTNDEILIGEFTDPDVASEYAKKVTLETLTELGFKDLGSDVIYFSIEVETVIGDPEDEDGGTMNIGTIYHRNIYVVEEADFEKTAITEDPIIELSENDFEFLEDGALKVSCKILKDFNKNDNVIFKFLEESSTIFPTFKIVSKVKYKDGDYYHCEIQL